MATTRQDAWTEDEDLLLAEVVLRHIQENGTQLSAFKEVGRSLSRTPAACGFRWNSAVRKQYKEQIEEAKQRRKERTATEERPVVSQLTIGEVIAFLQNININEDDVYRFEMLERKVGKLEEERKQLLTKLEIYEQEYRTLFEYMDKKRNFVVGDEKGKVELLREHHVFEKIDK